MLTCYRLTGLHAYRLTRYRLTGLLIAGLQAYSVTNQDSANPRRAVLLNLSPAGRYIIIS